MPNGSGQEFDHSDHDARDRITKLEAQVKVLSAFHNWTATQALPQLLSLTESNQQQIRDLVTHLQAFNTRLSDVEDKLFTPHDPI